MRILGNIQSYPRKASARAKSRVGSVTAVVGFDATRSGWALPPVLTRSTIEVAHSPSNVSFANLVSKTDTIVYLGHENTHRDRI